MIRIPVEDWIGAFGRPIERPGGLEAQVLSGLCVDSRAVQPGELFVGLPGQSCDGGRFAQAALAAGAALAVVGPGHPGGDRILVLDDPFEALDALVVALRAATKARVIAITGSVGKTTLKDLLAALLKGAGRRVAAAPASFNNREGRARTFALLEEDTEFLICELGTNAPGEIAEGARCVRPEVAVVTAIAAAHLEGLGCLEGVRREKLTLFDHLVGPKLAFLNDEDPGVAASRPAAEALLHRVRRNPREGCLAPEAYGPGWMACDGVRIEHPLPEGPLSTALMMAVFVARALEIPAVRLVAPAAELKPSRLRGEVRSLGQLQVILDCYNANPVSMRAALERLGREAAPRFALLGEMLELGAASQTAHEELGRRLAAMELAEARFLGPSQASVARAAGQAHLGLTERSEAVAFLRSLMGRSGTLLLKASRGLALEALLAEAEAQAEAQDQSGGLP